MAEQPPPPEDSGKIKKFKEDKAKRKQPEFIPARVVGSPPKKEK